MLNLDWAVNGDGSLVLVPGLRGGNYEGLRRNNEVADWGSLWLGEES